jgi:hypothetical protein
VSDTVTVPHIGTSARRHLGIPAYRHTGIPAPRLIGGEIGVNEQLNSAGGGGGFVNPFDDLRGRPGDAEPTMTIRVCPTCQVGHIESQCWLCGGPTVQRKIATPQGHAWHAIDRAS